MKKSVLKFSERVGRKLTSLLRNGQTDNQREMALANWFRDKGDKTLRLNYDDLTKDSIVFDLGGYEGQWASDIFAKYGCYIYVFEPVEEFFDFIKRRFSSNSKISVQNFGLADNDAEVFISIDEFKSSIFPKNGSNGKKIQLRQIQAFIEGNNIHEISLMKINIEGAEYDLLEFLLDSGYIKLIKNLQIQFHDFAPNAEFRMKKAKMAILFRLGRLGTALN